MKLRNGTIRIFRRLNFAKWLWLGESTMNSGRRENYIELLQNKLHSRTPTSLRRFLYGQLSLTQLRCSHRQTRWSGCQFNLIVVWGLVVYHLAGPWDEIVKIENNNTTGVFTSINSDELSNWNVFETNSLEVEILQHSRLPQWWSGGHSEQSRSWLLLRPIDWLPSLVLDSVN